MKNGIPVQNIPVDDDVTHDDSIKNEIIICETLDDFKEIITQDELTVVDFTATWCGPCKQIAPFFHKLSEIYNGINFVKVDVDDNEETSVFCQVSSMPTFQFWKNNILLKQFSGADPDKLLNTIKELL